MPDSVPALADRVVALAAGRPRVLLGLVGPPGAGKSTLAAALIAELRGRGRDSGLGRGEVVDVPMDGFHLADVTLDALGLRDRKGALETFDGDGFVALLERLRTPGSRPVYAPGFERTLEQPIAAAITVPPAARVVLVEGNYLLADAEPWRRVRELLDECWYLEVDDELRRRRLKQRHVEFGKSPDAARAWVREVDEPNAALVCATREAADRVIALG